MLKRKTKEQQQTNKKQPVKPWMIILSVFALLVAILAMNPAVKRELSALMIQTDEHSAGLNLTTANALAMQDTVALIAYQASTARNIHASLLQELGPEGFFPAMTDPDQGWVHRLAELLSQKDSGITQVVAGVYPASHGYEAVLVALGDFSQDSIRQTILSEFDHAEAVGEHQIDVYKGEAACQHDSAFSILIADNTLVIGEGKRLQQVSARLKTAAPSKQGDLQDWARFTRSQLLSSVILMPSDAAFTLDDPAAASILNRLYTHARRHGALYVGASIIALPARIQITTRIRKASPGTGDTSVPGLTDDMLHNALQRLRQQYRAVKLLSDQTETEDRGDSVILRTRITPETLYALQTLPLDYLGETIGLAGMIREIPPYTGEEKLQDQPEAPVDVLNLESLEYTDETGDRPDAIAGPFALIADAVADTPDGHQFSLIAIAGDIPNRRQGAHAEIQFESADKSATEAGRPCHTQNLPYPIAIDHTGVKSEITIPVSDYGETLAGEVVLSVPKQIRSTELPVETGQRLHSDGMVFEIMRSNGTEIHYRVTGNTEKFLGITGYNSEGNALRVRYQHRAPYTYGYGERGYIAFMGAPQKLSIRTAASDATERYPFTLNTLPRAAYHQTRTAAVKYYDYEAGLFAKKYTTAPQADINKTNSIGSTTAGPFNISIANLEGMQALSLSADIYSEPAYNLENNYTAVVLQLDALTQADGAVLTPADNATWRKPVVMRPLAGLLHDKVYLPLTVQANTQRITQLRGRLTLTMSKQYSLHNWEAPQVGDSEQFDGVTFTLTRLGRTSLTLRASGQTEKIVTIQLLDKDRQQVFTTDTDINTEAGWEITLKKQGDMASLLVLLADEHSQIEYPFTITLD